MISGYGPDDDTGEESVLALIKSVPGNVSLESMLTEIRKLRAARAIGLPGELFTDVAPRVLAGWRARAMVDPPALPRRPGRPARRTRPGRQRRRAVEHPLPVGRR
jgi:hypothetical protein